MSARPGNPLAEFVRGVAYPMRGAAFLAGRPRLWHLAVLPFILSLAVYGAALWLGVKFGREWVDHLIAHEGAAWKALEWIIDAVLFVVLLLVVAFTFIPLASLVANPFCDLLSEHVEKIYLGKVDDAKPFTLRLLVANLGGELKRAATLTLLLGGAWLLNFIPVWGNALAAGLSALITVLFLSLEYTSFSMDRRHYPWVRRKEYLRTFRARTMGFGALSLGILMVPVLNAVFIPVAAVAGTLLFCDTALGGGDGDGGGGGKTSHREEVEKRI